MSWIDNLPDASKAAVLAQQAKMDKWLKPALNLCKLALAAMLCVALVDCTIKVARADEAFKTAPGMKFKAALMCDHPAITLDLIRGKSVV